MMKEYIEGYHYPYEFFFNVKEGGETVKKPFKLANDYHLKHPQSGELITIKDNYTAFLRQAMFEKVEL